MKEPERCSQRKISTDTVWSVWGADLCFLVLVSLLGLALRLDFLIANRFVIDSDEAIVGLMAKHILAGHPIPTFYYGQHYMGSLEAILAAGLFALFGVSSIALKLVPLAFSIALIWIQYALGATFAGRGTARIAALLIAVPPSALVIWSAMARGGFVEVIVIGSLALLFALRGFERGFSAPRVAAIGFLIGIGWWVNNQIVYFVLPIGLGMLFAALRMGGFLRMGVVGSAAFVIGSLPFWRYNLEHHFASLGLFRLASPHEIATHVVGLFSTALPILVGAQRFWAEEGLLTGSAVLASVLYLALVLVFTTQRCCRGSDSCVRSHAGEGAALTKLVPGLLIAMGVVACGIFVMSSFGNLVQAPRYLLPLYVPLFLLVGQSISWVAQRSRAGAYALLALVLVLHLSSSYAGGRAIPGEPFVAKGERVAKDHTELYTWFRENKIAFVRTNYWVGYRVAFETDEQTRFLMYQDPHYVRIPAYEQAGRALDPATVPYVLVPAQADIVRMALRAAGYKFHERTLSGYQVFSDVRPPFAVQPIAAGAFSATSSSSPTTAALAIDGDAKTRWGTGHPQASGMEFSLGFPAPHVVCGVHYDISGWPQDYPRQLQLQLVDGSNHERTLVTPDQFAAIRYFMDDQPQFSFYFDCMSSKQITLRQLGSDPVFDWSIGELELWTRVGDAL